MSFSIFAFAEEVPVESIDRALGKVSLTPIYSTGNFELTNCKILTNCDITKYAQQFKLIIIVMTRMIPEISKKFSFQELTYKIKIVALNNNSYQAFVKELGWNPRQTPRGFTAADYIIVDMDHGSSSTVLHEMMHILIHNDLQGIAATWIDGGIPRLYENSGWKNGYSYVKINFGLKQLKQVIDTPDYIKLTDLARTDKFYYDGRHFPFDQARFIMYYLNEKNLLEKFYKNYKVTMEKDHSGLKALEQTTGMSVDQFEREWLGWMRNIRS
jgi:hypothetical protein